MAQTKIRVGDEVLVRSGKDKGSQGKVLRVDREANRVVVEGVNRVVRHQKAMPTPGGSTESGLIHKEAPIHLSNVMLVGDDGKATRIGTRTTSGKKTRSDGSTYEVQRRVRVSKRTGKDVSDDDNG